MKMDFVLEDIENAICEEIGVSMDDMISKTKKGACVKARHLSIYILHTEFGVSIRYLSRRYGCTVRQVFRINNHMADYIAYSSQYKDLYTSIMSKISPSDLSS